MKHLFTIITALFVLISGSAVLAAPTTLSVSVKDSIKIDLPTGKNLVIHFQTADIVEHKIVNHKLVISGKRLGKTALTITNDEGYHAEYLIDVIIENVRKRKVSELLEQICPEGTVTFVLTPTKGDNNGQLILQGTVPSKGRGERLEKLFTALDYKVVNLLSIEGTQQVQLFVRVAEVIKGNPMSIGVTLTGKKDGWNLISPGTNLITNLVAGIGILDVSATAITAQAINAPNSDAFQLGLNFAGADWMGVLSLMEGHNLAKVLAQPTLVVESGQSARFHAGGEIPTPMDTDDGISVEWKSYGVILAFTPDVLENGNIHITLDQEVSNLDWANGVDTGAGNIPALRTRTTKTSIKLKDGESFMVSGLLQEEIRSLVNKIPLLGDIPILGALFRSSTYEKNQTELAIVVTPRLVNPIPVGEEIRLPGQHLTTPSAFEALLLGKVVKRTNEKAAYALLGTAGLEMP